MTEAAQDLLIGDAVVRAVEPDGVVMTIYDFECARRVALCNWLVGHQMFKARHDVRDLVKLDRSKLRRL